jgi:hypothetical protein
MLPYWLPGSNGMDSSSPYGIYVPNWRSHQPVKRKEKSTMKIIRVGVDLAKNIFQVHGVDRNKKPVWKRKLNREEWLKVLLEKIEPGCEIGMEACGGAHHWARKLQSQGYLVKLIAPQFVKPYVKSNKNDANVIFGIHPQYFGSWQYGAISASQRIIVTFGKEDVGRDLRALSIAVAAVEEDRV